MNVNSLERCYKMRWLDLPGKWKAADRLRAGVLLYRDFYRSGFTIHTLDPSKVRVDCEGFKQPTDARAKAEARFRKAIKIVPRDFWPIVQLVCLENICLRGSQQEMYVQKIDLCRGLDYLCDFYALKKR